MDNKNISITKASISDIESIYEIDKLSFPIPWTKDSIENEFKNMLSEFLVAKIDNQVIGYIISWIVMDECQIANLAIHPDYRKQKIASNLINELIKICKKRKVTYILLEVRISNTPAINLYKTFGFTEEVIRKDYYKNKDGSREDAINMMLEL